MAGKCSTSPLSTTCPARPFSRVELDFSYTRDIPLFGDTVLERKLNRLRTASYVGLLVGVIISVVGGGLASTIYGGSCSANLSPCQYTPPPEDVLGDYLFYLGVVVIIVSLVALVFSLTRQPSVVV